MKCRPCHRIARFWGWQHRMRTTRMHMVAPTCSPTCSHIWGDIRAVIDPNALELAAMAHASDKAGEYIEAIKKTDMAKWTQAEWSAFIEVICGGYVDSLCAAQAAAMEALSKVQPMP